MMGKRKRDTEEREKVVDGTTKRHAPVSLHTEEKSTTDPAGTLIIQIITGSYEKALHGLRATICQEDAKQESQPPAVSFADTFLFNAHSSAIRSLAISPPSTSDSRANSAKVILASGGTDERINLYYVSCSPAGRDVHAPKLSLSATPVKEDPRNKELGSLLHHSSSISALHFPSKSKLLSASEDNTIAVIRTRDWTVLSTIKIPIPKAVGRPSGDTAPLGTSPAGVNDFAVHPSMKLMVSVSKGERCMRLWNLVTGKKAGVLNFGREILQEVREGKWGSGEGRKVEWDSRGEEFAVCFERAVVIFGMDSKPKCRVMPQPPTKVHQIQYIKVQEGEDAPDFLAVSTEDGRIVFYSTQELVDQTESKDSTASIPVCRPLGQLGGKASGVSGRIKDFESIAIPSTFSKKSSFIVVAGSSDGAIRLWKVGSNHFDQRPGDSNNPSTKSPEDSPPDTHQIGALLGTYETGNRITCLKAFLMSGTPEDSESKTDMANGHDRDEDSSDDSDRS